MRFETHSTLKVSYKQNVDVQSIVATGRGQLLSLLQHFYKTHDTKWAARGMLVRHFTKKKCNGIFTTIKSP